MKQLYDEAFKDEMSAYDRCDKIPLVDRRDCINRVAETWAPIWGPGQVEEVHRQELEQQLQDINNSLRDIDNDIQTNKSDEPQLAP